MKKPDPIILVQHKPNKPKEVIAAFYIETLHTHANRLLKQKTETKFLKAFTASKYLEIYGTLPERTEEPQTPELKQWVDRIKSNKPKQRGGWRGYSRSAEADLSDIEGDTYDQYTEKVNWNLYFRKDIRDRIRKAAFERKVTVTGMVENILVNWLNENCGLSFEKTGIRLSSRRAYALGQLMRIEEENYQKTDFHDYIKSPNSKIKSLKKRLKEDSLYTREIETIFQSIKQGEDKIDSDNLTFFFAGYCGEKPDFKL